MEAKEWTTCPQGPPAPTPSLCVSESPLSLEEKGLMCPVGYVVSVPAIGWAPYLEPTMDTQPGGNLASWELMPEKGTGVFHFPKRPSWSEGFRQLGVGDWRWLGAQRNQESMVTHESRVDGLPVALRGP